MHKLRSAQERREHLELQEYSFKWLVTLPKDVRPIALGQKFPRILNRLALISNDLQVTLAYLKDLLTPARRGRQGFPGDVAGELHHLYLHLWRRPDEDLWPSAWMDKELEKRSESHS